MKTVRLICSLSIVLPLITNAFAARDQDFISDLEL
jgi:hypothetical protein